MPNSESFEPGFCSGLYPCPKIEGTVLMAGVRDPTANGPIRSEQLDIIIHRTLHGMGELRCRSARIVPVAMRRRPCARSPISRPERFALHLGPHSSPAARCTEWEYRERSPF